jgi:hypothetical protein
MESLKSRVVRQFERKAATGLTRGVVWWVKDPSPGTTDIDDIMWSVPLTRIQIAIWGTDKATWDEENTSLYLKETEAKQDAEERLKKASSAKTKGRFAAIDPRMYIPSDLLPLNPERPAGTNLTVYRWEWQGSHRLLIFMGNSSKPITNLRSPRGPAPLDAELASVIKNNLAIMEMKQKQKSDKAQFQHNIKVGDIFVASWGYDQTNIDYYQVTKVLDKAVEIREIGKKVVSDNGPQVKVMPAPDRFDGPPMRKIPQFSGNSVRLKLNSFSSAYPWDGRPDEQTGSGYGH